MIGPMTRLSAGLAVALGGLAKAIHHGATWADPLAVPSCLTGEFVSARSAFEAGVHCWGCPVALAGIVLMLSAALPTAKRAVARVRTGR